LEEHTVSIVSVFFCDVGIFLYAHVNTNYAYICLSVTKNEWKEKCSVVATVTLARTASNKHLIRSLQYCFSGILDICLWVRLVVTMIRETVLVNKLPNEQGALWKFITFTDA
jgi:Na+-translocating ferredoxin:NAD+ oxidoreductase RnfA subunit